MYTRGDDTEPTETFGDTWNEDVGLRRGVVWGLAAAALLSLLLAPLAVYAPIMIAIVWLRVPLAFGLIWLLGRVVERAAGMSGYACLMLSIVLAGLTLCSNHVPFALHGLPTTDDYGTWIFPVSVLDSVVPLRHGRLLGWNWFHPYALLAMNGPPLALAGIISAALARRL